MMPWRVVEWEPVNSDGTQWLASYGGLHRGQLTRVYAGRYYVRISGRTKGKCAPTMRECARELVAFVNNIAPSKVR